MSNISDTVADAAFIEETAAAAAAQAVGHVEEQAYASAQEPDGTSMLLENTNPKKRGRPPGKTNKTTLAFLNTQQQRTTTSQEGSRAVAAESSAAAAASSTAAMDSVPQGLDECTWEDFFYQLFVYKSSRMRSIPITLDYTVPVENKTCRLGLWVDKIREEYNTHGPTVLPGNVDPETELSVIQLSEDRIKALNALGFTWSRNAASSSTGPASGRSTTTARSTTTRGKKRPDLSFVEGSEGIEFSNALEGEKRMNKDAIWDEMYQRLVLYHARYGYCHIPPNFDEKTLEDESTAALVLTRDMSLRSWVARQRSLFKGTAIAHGKPYVLKPERRALLVALGFDQYVASGFDNTPEPAKGVILAELGTVIVPGSTDEQQLNEQGVVLPPPAALPAVMGGFKMRFRKNWNEYYEDLKEYKNKYGDCNVPQFWSTDRKLGKWVAKQRYQYNLKMRNEKSQLTDTRMLLLNQLGFNWGGIRVGAREPEPSTDEMGGAADEMDGDALASEEMEASATVHHDLKEASVDMSMDV